MGIHGFFGKYIVRLFKAANGIGVGVEADTSVPAIYYKYILNSVSFINERGVSRLHIDANSIVYEAVNAVYYKGEYFSKVKESYKEQLSRRDAASVREDLYKLVFELLVEIIEFVRPKLEVSINFDGRPPWAKVIKQRQGRYADSLTVGPGTHFSTVAITPGTSWMDGLDKYLQNAFIARAASGGGPSVVVYSSYRVKGEGEHKIIDRIISKPESHDLGSGLTVIYANDSDVVLLSMLTGRDNIAMCSGIKYRRIDKIASDVGLDERERPKAPRHNFLNISELKSAIIRDINNTRLGNNVIGSFVVAMSFIGNDFIPRPYSQLDIGQAVQNIIIALKMCHSSLFLSNKIDWYGVRQFLKFLIEGGNGIVGELDMIERRANESHPSRSRVVEASTRNGVFRVELFRDNWYSQMFAIQNPELANSLGLTYASMRGNNDENIRLSCVEYLKGVSWTFAYYTHRSTDFSWTWYYPNGYAPLISDMYKTLDTLISSPNGTLSLEYEKKQGEPKIIHQLVAVIPHFAIEYVPQVLRPFWQKGSPVSDMLPIGIIIDKDELKQDVYEDYLRVQDGTVAWKMINVSSDWTSTKVMPQAPYHRIAEALATVSSDKSLLHLMTDDVDLLIKNEGWVQAPIPVERTVVNDSSSRGGRGRGGYSRGRSQSRYYR